MASFVVGPYPDLGQHLDQLLHGVDAVVHTGEQHGLVAQRHTGVGVLMKGVQQVGGAPAELLGGGDGLPPDGVMWIVGINEGEVVGGNGHAQGAQTGPDARLLLGRQGDVFLQILQGLGPVGHLPAPVVPVGVGHIGEKLLTARFVRKDHMGRPPFMGLGHRPYRYFCSK